MLNNDETLHNGTDRGFFARNKGLFVLILLAVAVWAVFKILTPSNFGTPRMLTSYLQTAIIYAVGGCGLYFICVMGLWDFSIGANIVLSSVLACQFAQKFGYAGLILVPLISGTIMGLCNGLVYIRFHIPSMIVTVGLSLIYESLSVILAGGVEQQLGENLRAFGTYPANLILAACAFIFAALIIHSTKIGTYTYAIGSNELVAKNMGVDVNKYKVVAFVLCGFLVGVMSILTISYGTSMTSASSMESMSRNFPPLMGTFFGLAFRKYGKPITAIVVGEFIISLLFNGFLAMGADATINNVVTGSVLLLIVALTTKPVKGIVVK